MTLIIPNLHSGANLLAMILYSHRNRFLDKDVPTLGTSLSTFFANCQKLRETLAEPSPEINYEALGLIVQPGTHGESARFKILTDQSIACITMIHFDKRIATAPSMQAARLFVTPEVMQSVKDGTFATYYLRYHFDRRIHLAGHGLRSGRRQRFSRHRL